MNPKFERFVKKTEPRKRDINAHDDLFPEAKAPAKPAPEPEPWENTTSLFQTFRTSGNQSWLGQDYPAARASFNIINKTLHPDRPLARGIAVLAAKGTSFPDKRENCVRMAKNLLAGESTGEILLRAEPENPYDPNAVAILDAETQTMIGYIPKAQEVNKTYAEALAGERFCGGYIIEAKRTQLKGEENAMILIATGWL